MARAAVIGTGVGGSGIAGLLAGAGHDVTVFERNEFPGGKTSMYERDGFRVDMSVHVSPRGDRGPIGQLARRLEADLELRMREPWRLIVGGRSCRLPLAFTRPTALVRIALLIGAKPYNAIGALRLFRKVLGVKVEGDLEPYYGKPASEFIRSFTKDPNLFIFLNIMGGLMFVIPASEASTAEFIWAMSNWARDASTAYPEGGYGRIPESFLDVCRRHGGEVRLGEPVRRIAVEGGAVTGVETGFGFHPADIVVSNAGMRKTVELAGSENFDPSYVERVDSLRDSDGAVTVKFALDRKPTDELITVYVPRNFDYEVYRDKLEAGEIPQDPALYIVSPTVADPELAPPGKHLLLACAAVPPSLACSEAAAKMSDVVARRMEELFPGIEEHTVWQHRTSLEFISMMGGRGAGEAIGLAQRYDQDGPNRPEARLPVKGLYVVGVDAGGMGIGTERAADSAMNVFDLIVSDATVDGRSPGRDRPSVIG
jgi:phytoene dehydrogenase-like protein